MPTSSGKAVLLVNTHALHGEEWLEQAKEKLALTTLDVVEAKGFSKIEPLLEHIRKAKAQGHLIIVGGGDGTLSAAASILAGSDSVMGVLPFGTGNAFARDLSIPTDLDQAIEILTNGIACEVDLGLLDDRYFLNVATIGITVQVVRNLDLKLKKRFGRFVYAFAWAKALRKTKPFRVTIETENGKTEVEAVQLVIGNGHFHGGPLPLSPTAAITSGKLSLYAVEAASTWDFVKYVLLLPTGLQGILKTVHSESTLGGTVTATPKQSIVVDGEISAHTPVTFSVKPGALKVMTPLAFKG